MAREAFSLNSPLVVGEGGGEPAGYGLVATEGVELALGSLKRAEDGRGVILRLYEPHGKRGSATLRFAFGAGSVERPTCSRSRRELSRPEKARSGSTCGRSRCSPCACCPRRDRIVANGLGEGARAWSIGGWAGWDRRTLS